MAAAGIHPDQLSYFNEAACLLQEPRKIGFDGGSRCGPSWLDDSNVDWGQGLKQLRAWIEENAPGRRARPAYFGSVPPEAYGIVHEPIDFPMLARDPSPGLYVVSAHFVARMVGVIHRYRQASTWLLTTPPTAVVGHALYVYEIPARPR